MDKRDLILSRLFEIYQSVDGFTAHRNKVLVSDTQRPALLLFDADETVNQEDFNRKRPPSGPLRMSMKPETYILLSSTPELAGEELNAARARILKAVLLDEVLAELCHDGDIRYEGCMTGFAWGRSLSAEAGLAFNFIYILQPNQL